MNISFPIDAFSPITLAEMDGIKLMNRTDTKYLVPVPLLPALLDRCTGTFLLQEVNGNRLSGYRTLYYDTPAHDAYLLHLHGHAPRQKVRTRTYEDSGDTFLEIKDKTNRGRTKKKRVMIPSEHFRDFASCAEANEFAAKRSRWDIGTLSPALDISFSRLTLVNRERTERITVDLGLEFANPRTGAAASLPQVALLELKRDGRVRSEMQNILLDMRIFPVNFSKYCTGIMLTDPVIPRGRFKPRLIQLDKTIKKYA